MSGVRLVNGATLPALGLTAFALYAMQRRWRGIVQLGIFFVIPVIIILGAYVFAYFQDVIQVFIGQQGFQAAPPWAVAQNISDEIGLAILVALFRNLNTVNVAELDQLKG